MRLGLGILGIKEIIYRFEVFLCIWRKPCKIGNYEKLKEKIERDLGDLRERLLWLMLLVLGECRIAF